MHQRELLLLLLTLHSSGILAQKSSQTETYGYRLVRGAGRCEGVLDVKVPDWDWTPVSGNDFSLKMAAVVCAQIDCGSALSVTKGRDPLRQYWAQRTECEESWERTCFEVSHYISSNLELVCSESVRLVQGPSLCSGTLQLRWNQSWTSVCEGGIDLRDAEVVCRELGCGAPALLQGAPSGVGQVPLGQTFHCEGHESALMNCSRSRSDNCSSGAAAQLTCSDMVQLVGQPSRCAGTVEVRHLGEVRPVNEDDDTSDPWNRNTTATVCHQLNCGSAVSEEIHDRSYSLVWSMSPRCMEPAHTLRECIEMGINIRSTQVWDIVCSELLLRPDISVSDSIGGVFKARLQGLHVLLVPPFRVKCSIEPQYPGGFFQLLSPSLDHILPAVNHSALFLFSDAGPAHSGSYTCVYHLQVFSHNFSSQSHTLHISVREENNLGYLLLIPSALIVVVLFALVLCRRRKTAQKRRHSEDNFGVETYENVGLEQVPADSTYQSLFPETRDLIYEELRPPQLQDSV